MSGAIAFLGMGAMGSRMAARLVAAGHQVTVWNRTAERCASLAEAGARRAADPRGAARDADIVISMLRDDDAARDVWLDPEHGALCGMREGAIALECSTVTAGWIGELGVACQGSGVALLDAPVAGSRPQAQAGSLIFFVGGDAETLNAITPILDPLAASVHHAGPLGSGATVKLMVNALFATQLAAMAELIALARKSGTDPSTAIEIVAATPVCSPAAGLSAKAMLAGNFAPMFPIELVEKDLGYALSAARRSGGTAPCLAAVRSTFRTAIDEGHGGDNITGIAQLYA